MPDNDLPETEIVRSFAVSTIFFQEMNIEHLAIWSNDIELTI